MAALFHLAAILVGMLAVPVCHTYPAITYKASPAFQTYGLGLMPIFNYAKVYVVLTNFILRIKISIINCKEMIWKSMQLMQRLHQEAQQL